MSHFRDVVASMVKSLKEQYDQILSETIKTQVTRAMVKFQVELDILAQYVNSQSIVDIDSMAFSDLMEVQLNESGGAQQSDEQQKAAVDNPVVNGQNGNNNNKTQVVKVERAIPASGVNNSQTDNIFPMVKLINQPILDELLNGDIKIYGMGPERSIKLPRRKKAAKPLRKAKALNEDPTRKSRNKKGTYSLKRFHCKFCPRKYRARQGLKLHVEAKHPKAGCEPPRYNCDQCTANYSYIGNLRVHKKKLHENQLETGTADDK